MGIQMAVITDFSWHSKESVTRVLSRMSLFIGWPACWSDGSDAVLHQYLWHSIPACSVVDQVGGRMVIFVDRFDWEARGNCDGQQVLVLDVESLGFLCVGNVKTIGLAKSASNVFNRSFICTDPNLFPIRSGVGLSQSSKHLVHEAIEFFLFLHQ